MFLVFSPFYLQDLDHLYCYYSELFFRLLPISSLFVWSGGFLPCSFICCIFLCLLILLNLLFWGSPFCRLQVRCSHCFSCLPPVDEVGSVLCRLPGGGDWCLCSGGWGWILSFWWAGLHLMVFFGVSVNLL